MYFGDQNVSGRRVVTLIEQSVECFEHDILVPLLRRLFHKARLRISHADVNIGLPLAVAEAGTSSCMTSQCSTTLPSSTRKISTATIGFGPNAKDTHYDDAILKV